MTLGKNCQYRQATWYIQTVKKGRARVVSTNYIKKSYAGIYS